MNSVVIPAVATMLGFAPAEGPVSADSAAERVIASERAWSEAFLRHDLRSILQLLADDFVGIDGRGVVSGKAAELEEARPPSLGASDPILVSEQLSDIRVRIYGDTGVGSPPRRNIRTLRAESTMSFDLQPILEGELLGLRPLRPDDFSDLYEVASDPLIWEQHPNTDRYKEAVFQAFFREALDSGGALIAMDSKDGRVVGSSRFHGYDSDRSEIEIGWTFLARSCWGGVYNREMKQLMLRHAFRFVNSVIFLVGPDNLRSQRAMEKIGGIRAGSRPDSSGRDSLVYRVSALTRM